MSRSMQTRIRTLLSESEWLKVNAKTLTNDADLYAVGLTSHATIELMLALEEAFDIEFPDRLLRRGTFSSIGTIAEALAEIGVQQDAA